MKGLLRYVFHPAVLDIHGEGEEARRQAEQSLAQSRQDLANTKAQTPYYAGLGRALRAEIEVNHIAERIRASIR